MDSIALITLLLLAYKVELASTWPLPATSVNWYLPSWVFDISKLPIRAEISNDQYCRPSDSQHDANRLDKVWFDEVREVVIEVTGWLCISGFVQNPWHENRHEGFLARVF